MSQYMFKSLLGLADSECASLIKAEDNDANSLYLKCLSLIIVSRLRPFLRDKSELEVYKLTKDFKTLSKLKASDRHTIASYILKHI